ncbi:unnamed protein product [Arctogadus glacialis]
MDRGLSLGPRRESFSDTLLRKVQHICGHKSFRWTKSRHHLKPFSLEAMGPGDTPFAWPHHLATVLMASGLSVLQGILGKKKTWKELGVD